METVHEHHAVELDLRLTYKDMVCEVEIEHLREDIAAPVSRRIILYCWTGDVTPDDELSVHDIDFSVYDETVLGTDETPVDIQLNKALEEATNERRYRQQFQSATDGASIDELSATLQDHIDELEHLQN